ncbi:hypothetical protein A6D6_01783 [Alcanivorax xiamenensis]|uniref:Metallo-beta-lactamase domain-containing protein n=1 Tax=Alcanivorax xiamenensis TaxID=1177156 RepID=A0ABQ6Y938_9GAMM|nr:quinoprotein relay system zinc metallohydrolase 1 [Alcanivorax xiamenensis]KAF0806203.1 hypothetical protein A6D6_01783 [Alcanivorax xiamenensis]
MSSPDGATRSWLVKAVLSVGLALFAGPAPAFDYHLKPVAVAERTWMVQGRREELSEDNGGDIANAAFIATGDGVIVIDTGSTLSYGRALRAAIATVTDQPVRWVINTHHHPDHVFGNQAFEGAEISALPATIAALKRDADSFRTTLYQRLGDAVRGTETALPTRVLEAGESRFGDYPLRLFAFSGHSGADLVVLDPATGVLFTGDLVFHHRAPTTPHSPGIGIWREQLRQVRALRFDVLVPGHGPAAKDESPVVETLDYLDWLDRRLTNGAASGATRNEVIQAPLPERFADMALVRYELTRSVSHFYADYEEALLWADPDTTK